MEGKFDRSLRTFECFRGHSPRDDDFAKVRDFNLMMLRSFTEVFCLKRGAWEFAVLRCC